MIFELKQKKTCIELGPCIADHIDGHRVDLVVAIEGGRVREEELRPLANDLHVVAEAEGEPHGGVELGGGQRRDGRHHVVAGYLGAERAPDTPRAERQCSWDVCTGRGRGTGLT